MCRLEPRGGLSGSKGVGMKMEMPVRARKDVAATVGERRCSSSNHNSAPERHTNSDLADPSKNRGAMEGASGNIDYRLSIHFGNSVFSWKRLF